ncbi:MAG: hypothetical protein ABSB00_03030 [Minisyncoccia bacterium]|jgi:hypothetical protein
MKKNIWIGIILVVAAIAIIGAYFAGQRSGNTGEATNTSQATTSVSTSAPAPIQTGAVQSSKEVSQQDNASSRVSSDESASEVLTNKTTCATYKVNLEKQIYQGGYQYDMPVIYKVIYSRSLNTCLDERFDIYPANGTTPEEEVLKIDDVLTGGNVWTSQAYSPALKYWDAESILDQQAQQYL